MGVERRAAGRRGQERDRVRRQAGRRAGIDRVRAGPGAASRSGDEEVIAPDPTALIDGPYRPPRVRVGDVATCLYRDADVVITSVSDARIPWPRCRGRESSGPPRLLVADSLGRGS